MIQLEADGRVTAVILAGGIGSRMGSEVTKQRMLLGGRTVLYRTVEAFESCPDIQSIVLVVRECEKRDITEELGDGFSKLCAVVIGGKTRAESARAGFYAIPEDTAFVAIHDAARCLITPSDISTVIKVARQHGAATAVSAVHDTVKRVDSNGKIIETLDRAQLRAAETPQIFAVELYRSALSQLGEGVCVTDDNMLLESLGIPVYSVELKDENIKITTARDLEYAEFVLGKREKYV